MVAGFGEWGEDGTRDAEETNASMHPGFTGTSARYLDAGADWAVPTHMVSERAALDLSCARTGAMKMIPPSVRLACTILAVIGVLAGPTACSAEADLDFHIIQPQPDAIPQVATMCRTGEQKPFVYRFPAGKTVELLASAAPVFSVGLGNEVVVRLTALPPVSSDGVSMVNAEVILPSPAGEDAAEHRRKLESCDLLIVVDGKPVGVAYGGTGQWEGAIPAGAFNSYETAEAVYADSVGRINRTVATAAVVQSDAALSAWLERRDAWVFHCHPETKAAVKTNDPATYERLRQLPKPDCQRPPTPPE